MRITWMPRLCIPMKDVASCDKLRSAARQALPAEDCRMGKPLRSYVLRPGLTIVFDSVMEWLNGYMAKWLDAGLRKDASKDISAI